MRVKSFFISIVLFALLATGAYFGQQYYCRLQKAKHERFVQDKRKSAWQELQQRIQNEISQFKEEVGIAIIDLGTDREIAFNKSKLFPSASLAKIPLMAACFLAAEQGRLKLDRNIALKSSDKFTGSGVLKDMPAGTTFSWLYVERASPYAILLPVSLRFTFPRPMSGLF